MRNLFIRLAILLTSTFFCFGVLELVARQGLSHVTRKSVSALGGALEADPELLIEYTPRGRRLVPNADVVIHNHYVSGLDVDIKTNSLGLRDVERSSVPEAGVERLLFLGDSIVVQDYLPSEKSLPILLEQRLNAGSVGRYEVINSGLSNAGLEEEIVLLKEVVDRLKPTTVLVSLYMNDSRPAWGYAGEIGTQRGWLRKHSIVFETIVRELEVRKWLDDSKVERFEWMSLVDTLPWKTDREAFLRLIDKAPYDWGSAWDESTWPDIERQLVELKSYLANRRAHLLVVAMPVRYQVEADYVEDYPQRTLGEILKRINVPYLSLLEVERRHRTEEIFYDWCHPTERGNQIIAPEIATFISENRTKGIP